MRHVFFFVFFSERAALGGGGGGGGAARLFLFVPFSLFSRPRAELTTVQSSFFGLTINTLNARNNNNNIIHLHFFFNVPTWRLMLTWFHFLFWCLCMVTNVVVQYNEFLSPTVSIFPLLIG